MKILNRGKDSKDTESFNKIKVNDEPSLKLLNSILNEESNLGNRSISEMHFIYLNFIKYQKMISGGEKDLQNGQM